MMERQACAEMEDAGMVVYCPIYRREYRNRAKKWIIREFPLLQGYVFLRADTVNWYKLAGCKQVASILRSIGGEPIGISEVAVEDIRSRQLAGDFDTLRVHDEYVKPGQKVKVSTGALAGLESVVASVKNTTAVNILVQIFGREVQATVPLETLERKE
ncbi:MAG: hypothetical protein KF810_17420 [Rhizobiaceae bacterium]|nr:hypothetical protein [Rhizobiaceae bacterium]